MFYSSGTVGGAKAISAWFPPGERGFAMGLWQAGVPLGGAIAAALLPALAIHLGWRAALTVAAIIAMVGSVAAYIGYREPDELTWEEGGSEGVKLGRELRSLFTNRNLLLTSLSALVLMGSQIILVAYLVLALRDQLGIPVAIGSAYLVELQL